MTDDELDDKLTKAEAHQKLISDTLELLSKPRDPMAPTGDPELDKILSDIRRCLMCKRDKMDKTTEPCDYCKPPPDYPRMAPEGEIFVCGACGKTSKDLYGDERDGGYSWDESCMLNAVLCYEGRKDEDGHWIAVEGY